MHLIDIFIIIFYVLAIFSVGFFLRGKISSFSEFMIANRKIGIALGVASMAGTELGLITVMYNAQKGWSGQFASFHIGLIAFFVTLAIGLSGFVISKLRDFNVKSIPEFYNIRYGKNVRIIGAIFLILAGVLNMGIFLKVGAVFLSAIFGDIGVGLNVIMIGLLILVLFYTMMGGMLSVIITDYIQFVVLSIGLLSATFLAIHEIGWTTIFNTFKTESAFNPVANSDFGYDYIVWMVIIGFGSAVIWPTATTRALAMKDSKSVKKQYLWSSISFLIRFIIPCFLGICAFVYFDGNTTNSLALFPKYLSNILPVGALGLVVAGMLAAFMSTHDSYLLCWSSIITNDIIEPISGTKLSSNKKIYITRVIILLLGLYVFIWGMFYEGSDAIWDYLGITGAVYFTGAISVIVMGLYWEKASSKGAILSLLGGFSAIIGLEPIRDAIGISLNNPSVIGLGTLSLSILLMIFGSLMFPDSNKRKVV